MSIDIKTLIFSFIVFSTILLGVQFYYLKSHKTYPGAKDWFRSSLCLFVCYFFTFLRESHLPVWTSIFIGNSFLLYGVYLRLKASSLFVLKKSVPNYGLMFIAILFLWAGYFYFVNDSIALRSMGLMSLYAILLALTGMVYFYGLKIKFHGFYLIMFLSQFIYSLFILWRGIYWMFNPETMLFSQIWYQQVFFATALFLDIGTTQVFIIMNTTRLGKNVHEPKTFTPICVFCKSIKLPNGQWQALEKYLSTAHSGQIQNTVCPHCTQKGKSK